MCYLCLNYAKIPFDSEHNIVQDDDGDGWRDIGDGIGALTLEEIEELPKWSDLSMGEKLKQYEEAEKAVEELKGVASRTIQFLENNPPYKEKIKQAEEDLNILRRNYSKTLSYLVSSLSSPPPDEAPPTRATWWDVSAVPSAYERTFLGGKVEMKKDENEKKKHKGKKKEKHTKR